jgi:DNA-binding transcriptional ArsR family regulator
MTERDLNLTETVRILKALADPTRLAIIECLVNCDCLCCADMRDTPSMCLVDVRKCVPCAPNAMTRHLSLLREAGLIHTETRGREVLAQLNREAYERFLDRLSPRPGQPDGRITLTGG